MQKRKRLPRTRNWCFTAYVAFDPERVYQHGAESGFRYICAGQEICPKSNRAHIQGWAQFDGAVSRSQAQKRLGLDGCHFEPCKGSCSENDDYCKKDGAWKSCGKFLEMGQRVDLDEVKAMLDSEAKIEEICEASFGTWLRHTNAFRDYRQIVQKTKSREFRSVVVVLLSGATGTNKSRWAHSQAGFVIKGHALSWWDGYDAEECIAIDEYSNDVKITQLLSLLDGYQLRLPIKGGFVYARWERVIITTNLRELHEHASDAHRAALARRITDVRRCWNGETIDLESGLPA